jgi:hypothetical protein
LTTSRAFEAAGIRPVPGAFIAGLIIAFIFMRRRSRDAELPGAGGQMGAAMPMGVSFKTGVSQTDSMSLTVDVPAAVMPHIRAGDQIAAIKLLRASAGVGLKTAKQIVDTIRASPLARQ